MDREKVIETFKERICTCSMIGDGFDVTINWKLADDILALLKEQEEQKRNPVIVCPHCGKRVK